MQNAYIIDAVRTPVGKRNGDFKTTRPDDLLAHSFTALLARNPNIDPAKIDDVIVGCAMPEAQQGLNVARIASLLAGIPNSVPAYTLNRFCASGLQSVANAATMIQAGSADIVLAGGVESMSQIPMTGNKPSLNIKIFEDDNVGIAYGMGLTAEKVAQKFNIDKQAQNEFALKSHQKALAAQEKNAFVDEIAPVTVMQKNFDKASNQAVTSTKVVSKDQGPRADTSIEALNKLRPAFDAKGAVSAGNSSQMSDGAACVLLVSEKMLKQLNLIPSARFVGYATAGVAPEIMGIGPVQAIPKALKQSQLSLSDLSWIELNEAFAAQSLAVINELNIDHAVVNPLGGAIALGHPLGATGAIRTATLMSAFNKDKNLKYGMVTMCIGAGMGAAGIFENMN